VEPVQRQAEPVQRQEEPVQDLHTHENT
jgi:hypothetical protein